MTSTLTSKFRSDSVKLLLDDIQTNDYYLFASSLSRIDSTDSVFRKNDFLEKTIFGKKIEAVDNFFYMIKNYPWQSGVVYDQYDDREDLADKRYYVAVYPENNDTGVFRIYKCLFNNYGSTSEFPPNYNVDTPDQIYKTGDGYVWKYMYEISEADFDKYATVGYIPITANNLISNTAIENSSIEKIMVENNLDNNGYESIQGSVIAVNTVNEGGTDVFDTIEVQSTAGFTLSEVRDFYSGQYFYATANNASTIYTVDTYRYDSAQDRGVFTLVDRPAADNIIKVNAVFQVFPRIDINGDGSGAIAIPSIVDGSIVEVTMLNRGSGYTRAEATVIDPVVFDPLDENRLDARAVLRPVLSPEGGHASNFVDELSCKHGLVFTELTETDNSTIPITNQFSSIGLVRNPTVTANTAAFDNRILLGVANTSPLAVNEQVTQVDTNNQTIFSAIVHEIGANNEVYLTDFHGPYQNQANTSFSIDGSLPIRNSQGDTIEINTDGGNPLITYPPYEPKTGEVYYMNDFLPVERDQDSRELFKIVIEF